MVFHKVKSVKPLSDMRLCVEFDNFVIKTCDIKPLMDEWEILNDLKTPGLFQLVHVDANGYGIAWNDYLDLSCNELWDRGVIVRESP